MGIVHAALSSMLELWYMIFYKLCLPLVSIGNKNMAMAATKYKAPADIIGALLLYLPTFAATIGAAMPEARFRRLAMPEPVPLTGAGKTSGVYAYITPYMAFYFALERERQI
jgi:hypothetical protein